MALLADNCTLAKVIPLHKKKGNVNLTIIDPSQFLRAFQNYWNILFTFVF